MADRSDLPLTATHSGVYRAETCDGKLVALHPFERDPAPSAIAQGFMDALDGPLRIKTPMVRKAWLDGARSTHNRRDGDEPFVSVTWDRAEQLVADELQRVRKTHGNQAIYGGSYGWASAGRFHHAQSQLHRFLNCIGGYTRSVNSYSLAAGEVILTHVLGDAVGFIHAPQPWRAVVEHTELVVGFGGIAERNSQISAGGTGHHSTGGGLRQAKQAGVSFVNLSPIRQDVSDNLAAEWLAIRPGSDAAVMLGLAHELLINDLHDRQFLDRYTVGFDTFEAYLTGESDGQAKTAEWAASIANISADRISSLAKEMAGTRTMISVSWSLTRQDHGEQPFWMATTLAAMLGQIGLPGGGIAFGYGAANSVGNERRNLRYAALPQLRNPINSAIPVSRIADMLLDPSGTYSFNGETRQYPDIRLIYWAGGNPFHHHQDLTRLCKAWQRPETIIVHDYCWNALAKRADIVLPCTTPLERDDIMITPRDRYIVSMAAAVPPVGNARDDHDILRSISTRMGVEPMFSEGRSKPEWLEWIYAESRNMAEHSGVLLPEYEEFLETGWFETDPPDQLSDAFTGFRSDPEKFPLKTPSGKIEIMSQAIAAFEMEGILPHPAWYEPEEWLGGAAGRHSLHLISNQPADKLHSQLDNGRISRGAKINGRSPLRIHPEDAARNDITDGDCVRVHNRRGAFLATAVLDSGLLRGVVQVSTGAWLDAVPQSDGTLLCRHGNPNTVTKDHGTSVIAQGPSALSCLVTIEPVEPNGTLKAFEPPNIQPAQYKRSST